MRVYYRHERTAGADEPDALARAYAASRDPVARESLVRSCEPLVRGIAGGFRNGRYDEDLVQAGFLGLLNAIEHYDPRRGAPFLVFARHFVRGEIQHYLRDHYNLMRRPRWLDGAGARIDQAVGEHLGEHGRYPGLEELSSRLDLDPSSLAEILHTREIVRTLSLDAEDDEGRPTVDPPHAGDAGCGWPAKAREDRMLLIEAMGKLNPLQRTVVFYIYFTDLTQADAAARIGVSQKHVSRVLASALVRLRELLAPGAPAAERV